MLDFSTKYDGAEVSIAQPGLVTTYSTTWQRAALARICSVFNLFTRALPNIDLTELAAAAVEQVVRGFEKETLLNNDLVHIGQVVLKAQHEA